MKNMFDLKAMQKKGAHQAGHSIDYLIGALIVVVLATQLAPTFFTGVSTLNTSATGGTVPDWLPIVLYVIIGAGLVLLIWRVFGQGK